MNEDFQNTAEMTQAVVSDEPAFWVAPSIFLIESIVGVFNFGVIAAAAVGLNFAVEFLRLHDVDNLILAGLKIGEYSLFILDLVLFLRFLWSTGKRSWRRL